MCPSLAKASLKAAPSICILLREQQRESVGQSFVGHDHHFSADSASRLVNAALSANPAHPVRINPSVMHCTKSV
ncbi:hypothetical protein BOSE21B_90315 [Bosea sp. 21B]|nr:hypothetical protein BOSE21B_90315 [Bosea sp. 21B]VXB58728.1 hypothetical protein BOSE125_131154 [Bosea sp. 125]